MSETKCTEKLKKRVEDDDDKMCIVCLIVLMKEQKKRRRRGYDDGYSGCLNCWLLSFVLALVFCRWSFVVMLVVDRWWEWCLRHRRFFSPLPFLIICAVGRSAVVVMICCLKDTARQQRKRKREKKEIVERKRKRKCVCVCGYPTQSYNGRTSKMSFFSIPY
jgi:hypothetical protein